MKDLKGWAVERLYTDYAQAMKESRVLYDSETDHQRLRVIDTPRFGRVLTLDDVVQVTERDNFIYHEMLTHVPLFAHGQARRVLVIGGGDGGIAREVLRHPVESCTMVEIDPGVIEFCREHLPMVSDGAFDDPRLEIEIADGAEFMRRTSGGFDVIIVDSTDPVGPGETLFTDHFYGHAHRALAPGGILVTQNGVPFMQGDELTQTMRAFGTLFSDWGCYLADVPSYTGGPMALGWATDGDHRHVELSTLQLRFKESGIDCDYYTPEVHKAAFALPGYVQKLMPEQ